MAETRRVTIGFEGGQALSARLREDVLSALRENLKNGGWHDLPAEDGSALIYLPKVVYIQTDSSESRVGFGS